MPTTFSSTTVTSLVSRCARLMLAAIRSMHSSGVHSLLVDPVGHAPWEWLTLKACTVKDPGDCNCKNSGCCFIHTMM